MRNGVNNGMMTFKEKSEKTKKAVSLVARIIGIAVCVAYYVLWTFGKKIFGEYSTEYRSINLFSDAGDVIFWLRLVSIIIFVVTVSIAIRFILGFIASFLKKGKAFVNLLSGCIKCIAVVAILFMTLQLCGVDTVTLLTGIGIIGLVVGLAAQPLIEDILAGMFIVFEGVFDVGDMIVYNDFRGEVKDIGVRTTQIIDWGGNIKVVNNSDLRAYVNLSSKPSVAICEVSVAYEESVERVESVFNANVDRILKDIPNIIGGLKFCGVSELGASGVTLLIIADCDESNKYSVQRALNREMKLIFDENRITIPFTQVVVHEAKDKDSGDAQASAK